MSFVHFEKTILPCVGNDVTSWHVAHGWVWDVIEQTTGRRIGVLFCTRLCGAGVVVHFDTVPGAVWRPEVLLAAMRKTIRMLLPICDVIYATIPERKNKLIRVAIRLGFRIVTDGGYRSDGDETLLLKYFGRQKDILKHR